MRESIERHRRQPEVSTDEHLRQVGIALGASIAHRRKLYLDTRYWVLLRNVVLGRAQSPLYTEILERLRAQVAAGIALCPMSDVTFTELMRQSDPVTRTTTAQLIDELSLGVALHTEERRVGTEIAHYLYQDGARENVHPLAHLVWTRQGLLLGAAYPRGLPLDAAEEQALQKAFIDHLSRLSLADLVATIGEPPMPYPFEAIAYRLNASARTHAHQIRIFRQAVLNEVAGGLDLMKGQMADVMLELYARKHGGPPVQTPEQRTEQERRLHGFFIHLFEKRPQQIGKCLPTLYVHAKCHAAVRWDRKRNLDGHDLLDFHHAAAAVGYCDAFFTDHPLKVLLRSGHVALHKEFSCHVVASEREVLDYLRR
ncbi:hypothetical protein E4T66_20115 [Sinimarinibacterium sp. CAU 1509]|uniref:hypothetical protein n=1 Tax=Sinimarinibacterium sp. CAU 1509 TaxID=2562283 RepID=UPI0010AC986E|nr:hypothetical protein [Sinimarinibacterium sp. CAU 1509]TJY56265.1 hypothetical protein E4T66_20115 [Sinimarinibacterium sp. CAU 1509]